MKAVTQYESRGFTLIELLVVIGILLILITISVEGFTSFSITAGGDTSARTVLRALEEAHARTLSADGGTHYGVFFASTSATVFPGDTYVSGDASNTVYEISRATISGLSLTGGATAVVFTRIRGTASATGTIVITQTRDVSLTKSIIVHESGLVEVQ